MVVLKGAEVSAKIKEQVSRELEDWQKEAPKLAIVRVGENPDDLSYERSAVKKMGNFGLRAEVFAFAQDISDLDFKKEFQKINEDNDISGILLLRPLPKQICEKDIEKMIKPKKRIWMEFRRKILPRCLPEMKRVLLPVQQKP